MPREYRQAAMKERNNHLQGRSGSKVPIKAGPVKSVGHNPTKGGGINRATTR
jgi:hypothetical protein